MVHDAGAFRLEVGVFPIQRMAFASETHYQDGTLSIDRAALLAAIAEPRLIALPGRDAFCRKSSVR